MQADRAISITREEVVRGPNLPSLPLLNGTELLDFSKPSYYEFYLYNQPLVRTMCLLINRSYKQCQKLLEAAQKTLSEQVKAYKNAMSDKTLTVADRKQCDEQLLDCLARVRQAVVDSKEKQERGIRMFRNIVMRMKDESDEGKDERYYQMRIIADYLQRFHFTKTAQKIYERYHCEDLSMFIELDEICDSMKKGNMAPYDEWKLTYTKSSRSSSDVDYPNLTEFDKALSLIRLEQNIFQSGDESERVKDDAFVEQMQSLVQISPAVGEYYDFAMRIGEMSASFALSNCGRTEEQSKAVISSRLREHYDQYARRLRSIALYDIYGVNKIDALSSTLECGILSLKTECCLGKTSHGCADRQINSYRPLQLIQRQCPICIPALNAMALRLPDRDRDGSRVYCKHSGHLIDNTNEGFLLPNGDIIASSALLRNAVFDNEEASFATGYKCPDDGPIPGYVFPISKIERVFII
ncbi:hypothetical protein ACOME3_005567 [Neoechinorhynchus agilis]